jgi:hypothetical protein
MGKLTLSLSKLRQIKTWTDFVTTSMKITRTGLLESTVSALSLEAALTDGHVFARHVASCSVSPVNHLTILLPLQACETMLPQFELK